MAIELVKEKFIEQMIKYGYFAEQFPNCFSTEKLLNNLKEVLPLIDISKNAVKNSRKNSTAPTTLSMYKNDISRRVLSLPNIEAFLRLVKYMEKKWDRILQFAVSKNSLSPISFLNSYNGSEDALINSESLREKYRIKSDFIKGIKQSIRCSLGYKYRLKVDITNCYNSMYTHSIAWAICGKQEAKRFMRTKSPSDLAADYDLADSLDCLSRFQKNNETNGFIVGPFTSRITSEIILARIDKMLSEKGFVFKRYVDDYKFYFRSESQAVENLPIIEKILNEFNLSLNTAKTEITKYPYEIISNIKDKFEDAQEKDGVFGVLNTASQLHLAGEKGAYKYALKFLRGKALPSREELQIVIPTLINIMLLDPKYGKYVTEYLRKNNEGINSNTLSAVFNNELQKSLENELQQETLLFIQLMRDLNLEITGENLLGVLNSDNDFAIIIALDLWKNRNGKIIRTKQGAQDINQTIKKLLDTLKGEKVAGSRWLLLYELKANKILKKRMLLPEIEMNDFFKKLCELGVTFYSSVISES